MTYVYASRVGAAEARLTALHYYAQYVAKSDCAEPPPVTPAAADEPPPKRHRPASTNDGGHHGVVGVDDGDDDMPALICISDATADSEM